MTRTERQIAGIRKWGHAGGKGTVVASTGFGKTRLGLMLCEALLKKKESLRILVVVPTDLLQEQWTTQLNDWGFSLNSNVYVINSAIKQRLSCDLLILDEIHRYSSELFKQVFQCTSYTYVLGLTATFERLDGLHKIAAEYCPVIDTVSAEEAMLNGWVSNYIEYKVLLHPDLTLYQKYNEEFQSHFAFFNYDFDLAMNMLGKDGYKARIHYRDILYTGNDPKEKTATLKSIMIHSVGFARALQARKKFIYECPDKIRLTREIMKYRSDKKIITFSATTKIAESIGNGFVYTGKVSKKKSRITIEEFETMEFGTLHTVKKANEGMDIRGLSVAVNLSITSSRIDTIQKKGRVIRKEDNKLAEIFTFIVSGTVEEKWWQNSHLDDKYITIDEEGLMHVLKGEPYTPVREPIANYTFRW